MCHVLDTHIDINAPPERVWNVLLDFPAWKEWNPFIPSVTGKVEAGARLHVTVCPPGMKSMEFKPRVFAVRPGEEIIWGGSFLLFVYRGDHAILLESLPGGGTRFRQRERVSRAYGAPNVWYVQTDGAGIPSDEPGAETTRRGQTLEA